MVIFNLLYEELYDYYLGEKADYIPLIAGVEDSLDSIWEEVNGEDIPVGVYYDSSENPEYLDTYTAALVNDYGYTKTGDNVFVNEETGLRIEIETDEYGYVYIRFFEA